ncbi:MAG: hypothetical protein BYD32DRAFT_435250 [Podila humilis]|nr:MAG: hypothetical protein BYD32DRAFT_435250 [Podila humilis]
MEGKNEESRTDTLNRGFELVTNSLTPVFVQLKMRHKMTKTGTQSGYSTVKSELIHGHLQEMILQTFCARYPKPFLGVVTAYPAELAGVEGHISGARTKRANPFCPRRHTPVHFAEEGQKHHTRPVPQTHMQALDLLKGIKRQLNQTEGAKAAMIIETNLLRSIFGARIKKARYCWWNEHMVHGCTVAVLEQPFVSNTVETTPSPRAHTEKRQPGGVCVIGVGSGQ